jgi:hypothetical protein
MDVSDKKSHTPTREKENQTCMPIPNEYTVRIKASLSMCTKENYVTQIYIMLLQFVQCTL